MSMILQSACCRQEMDQLQWSPGKAAAGPSPFKNMNMMREGKAVSPIKDKMAQRITAN